MAINADKLLNKSSGKLAMQKAQQERMIGGGPANIVLSKKSIKGIEGIKINVIKIENILKGSLALDKKQLDDKKKATSKKRKEDIETKLETKPNAESGGKVKLPAAPRMGILDFIKNFIGNVLLGYFAVRLIKHLPKIMPILKFLGNAADFIIDIGGKLLNGLVTFIDIGYKAYDATRGLVKNLFGKSGEKQFDELSSTLNIFLNTAIIAGMLYAGSDGFGGGPRGGPKGRGPRGGPSAPGTRGTRTTSGGRTLDTPNIRNPVRQRPTITQGGKGAGFKLPGTRPKVTGTGGGFKMPNFKVSGKGRGGLLGFAATLGIEIFMPQLQDAVQQGYGALGFGATKKTDNEIIEEISKQRKEYNEYVRMHKAGPMASIVPEGEDEFNFGSLAVLKREAERRNLKYASGGRVGGITRGGKSTGKAKRTFGGMKKKQIKRTIAQKPTQVQIKPGADVGGEDKIFGIFPNPFKAAKKVIDAVNPFNIIKTTGEDLGKTDYFGPILAITSKMILGQQPDQMDYKNVGLGLNLLIAKGVQDGQLKGGIIPAFAEGGLVDPDVLSAVETGGDISSWVSNVFRGKIETGAQKTMRLIKENMAKKKAETDASSGGGGGGGGSGGDGGGGSTGGISGRGVDKGVSVAKKLIADLGVTPAQAAGIVGNFLYESAGMNPGEREGAPYGTPEKPPAMGTLRQGYGWAQWTNSAPGDRLDKFLKSYGGDKGKIATDDDNYRFLMTELKGDEPLKGMPTDDPQAASDWFRKNWERAGIPADEKRRKETLAVFNKIKGLSRDQAKLDVAAAGGVGQIGDTASVSGGAIPKGSVAQWLHGNPNRAGYDEGHAGQANAHDHFSFKSRAAAIAAYGKLKSSGYKPYEFEGYDKVGKHSPIGGHYGMVGGKPTYTDKTDGTAFDIPWATYGSGPIGKGDYDKSLKAAQIVGAYEKGGETLDGPHLATLGEKGPEFVFDANTTAGLDRLAPQLLEKLNFASTKPQLASILQSYASYDASASPQTIIVQSPPPPSDGGNNNSSNGSVAVIPILVGSGSGDAYSILYRG
jgi:hypothetical protein